MALLISIAWSSLTGLLGYEDLRPWGSFFLQYLWEFCLGMYLAEKVMRENGRSALVDVSGMRWWWLIAGAVAGMGLSGFMAWNGGMLKLYNDIPSLVGFLSVLLMLYKLGWVNRLFVWASGFSYELYLVHSLVFAIIAFALSGALPLCALLGVSLVAAYGVAYGYGLLLNLK